MSSPIRSSALVLQNDRGAVLTGRRTLAARSFPGYLAFPGGTCDDEDHDVPALGHDAAEPSHLRQERITALRELGEETGYWRLCTPGGDPVDKQRQQRFLDDVGAASDFAQLLRELDVVLDVRGMVPLGRWLTPPHRKRRFSVQQFLLIDDPAQFIVGPATDELSDIDFRLPHDVVRDWEQAHHLLLPPIAHAIFALHRHAVEHAPLSYGAQHFDAGIAALRATPREGEVRIRELCRGVFVQPLRSHTLPPATHTNCVLVGEDDFVIIDPAACDDDEKARFVDVVQHLAARKQHPKAVVLTHHHHDHVDAAAFVAERFGLPIWAHAETAKRVPFDVDRLLTEDDRLFDDNAPTSDQKWQLLHTPGHAQGHLCLLHPDKGVLVAGDMVAATGSILIDPDDGDLGLYLASLERLIALAPRHVVPAHGPMLQAGTEKLQHQLAHRHQRTQQVRDAVDDEPRDLEALTVKVYGDEVPPHVLPLAARSLESILIYLQDRGEVTVRDGGFVASVSGE